MILSEANWAQYHAALSIIPSVAVAPSFNIKPTEMVPVVTGRDRNLTTSLARWWFVPHWHKGNVKDWKQTTFNARIETAFEKPSFRTAWKTDRCLVPASGYYEWTGEKGKKQPHYITVEQNLPVFFFAGLHSTLEDGSETCTVLTRAATPEIARLHHRMPVILNSQETESWLDFADEDEQVIETYGQDWTDKFRTWPVRKFGIKDDGPELIERDGFDF
ncbi:SOS response-associated peptidase [Rhodobacteraceae bacterium]|nr:SOS response-associated peptidase [Paracoccaceae bacterium]